MTDPGRRTPVLRDRFARSFPYLRLSLTEICNFRCSYCLPDGYQKNGQTRFLSGDEIYNLVEAFSELGVEKIRLTGGEPTLRKDFTDIAAQISRNSKITQLAFTTNGYKLRENTQKWRAAGLTHVNVSLDSLDRNRFQTITGHDRLHEVIAGIDAAIDAGFKKTKINTVLLRDVNEGEVSNFIAFAKHRPVTIRFIELMQTGDNEAYFRKYHLSSENLRKILTAQGWSRRPRSFEDGPAQDYTHADYAGRIGIIAPYSKDFCQGCNRLRVTAKGDLRLCLFGNLGVPLRAYLQSSNQKPQLKELIMRQLTYKGSSHFLPEGQTGLTPHLASIGG